MRERVYEKSISETLLTTILRVVVASLRVVVASVCHFEISLTGLPQSRNLNFILFFFDFSNDCTLPAQFTISPTRKI